MIFSQTFKKNSNINPATARLLALIFISCGIGIF